MTSIAGTAPTRDRLLRAAARLFYDEGVTAVGVDRLCQAAGVSKRSMYQLFTTKDDLVAAALREHGPAVHEAYLRSEGTPRERILYVFEVLSAQSAQAGFHGCPFVNTAVELHDPAHRASLAAREFKDLMTAYFRELAASADDPDTLAAQLTMLFDGAGVRAVMTGEPLGDLPVRTATALLDAAGL